MVQAIDLWENDVKKLLTQIRSVLYKFFLMSFLPEVNCTDNCEKSAK